MAGDIPRQAPTALPWALCFSLLAMGGAAIAVAFALGMDLNQMRAVGAGLSLGGITAAFSHPRKSWRGVLAGLIASTITLFYPTAATIGIFAAAFAIAAGLEARHGASRGAIAGLFGWLMFTLSVAPYAGVDGAPLLLPAFWTSAIWGAAGLHLIGAAGFAIRGHRPMAPRAATLLSIYLLVGFLITISIVATVDHPRAYWFVLLFVLRALPPPGRFTVSAMRFATGATAGVLLALAVETLALPPPALAALALTLAVLGLRLLPHPLPFAPALFSMSILIAIAPGAESAILRLEAVAVAAALIFLTTGVAGLLLREVERG